MPLSGERKCVGILRQNLLVLLTLVGVGIGLLIGFMLAPTKPSGSVLMWIGMAGEVYLRTLKMMVVPLVVCCIVAGAAELDPRCNGRLGGVALLWILVTNLLGCIIGAVLCLLIKPGQGVKSGDIEFGNDIMETEDIFADLLRNIFPDNLVAACFEQAQTKYVYEDRKSVVTTNDTHNASVTARVTTGKYLGATRSANILGLVVVSAGFGVAGAAIGARGRPFLGFFRSCTAVILQLLNVFMWSTPVGVTSLVAVAMAGAGDVTDTFRKLGLYTGTVLVGQMGWVFLVLPLVYYYVTRGNPFRFYYTIMPSILLVFATVSTVMALPVTFRTLEDKNNVDRHVSRLVAPLFATTGRAASATYICVSCFFLIQLTDRDVTASDTLLVIVLTWVSTLAIPSVAGASLVTVLILLTALNIPGEAAAMLFALEFFLDRCRSIANLITQLTGVVVTQHFCAASLRLPRQAEAADHDNEAESDKIENGATLQTMEETSKLFAYSDIKKKRSDEETV